MTERSVEAQARALREGLAGVDARLSDPRAAWSVRSEARDELGRLVEEARALAERTDDAEIRALVAEVLHRKLQGDLALWQDSGWQALHPQLRELATIGEATGRPRGLELAAAAHLLMGESLVDPDDPQESPYDPRWGARELQEAVRVGRQAGTADGLLAAAQAGLRLADVHQKQGRHAEAAGLRDGVCATREQAVETLEGAEHLAFESALRDALGEDPARWAARNQEG